LLSRRIRSPRPPKKENKSSWAGPGGEGGYLDGVDDEAGQEEEQAERENDEHERDRHGPTAPAPALPISEGSLRREAAVE